MVKEVEMKVPPVAEEYWPKKLRRLLKFSDWIFLTSIPTFTIIGLIRPGTRIGFPQMLRLSPKLIF
jgi:hypothetical protein